MYFYQYLKRKYANQCRLLRTDTDSFLFEVQTPDFYKTMKQDSQYFDLSGYPKDSPFYSSTNHKVPGVFKDEMNGKIIKKFRGLRSKMYAILYQEEGENEVEMKKAKGIAKASIEHKLHFDMYESALFDKTELMTTMDLIQSHSHTIYSETVRKKTLSAFDDKRYLLNDGVSSLAYGHFILKE